MKKTLGMILILTISQSVMAVESIPADGQADLRHLPSIEDSWRSVGQVTFKKELIQSIHSDGTVEDDFYFQGGKRVERSEIDRTRLFCEIDTDKSYNDGYLPIKKGSRRVIKKIEENVDFQNGTYEVDMDLSLSERDSIDSIECSLPLDGAYSILVSHLTDAFGDHVEISTIELEK